ncbi:MAG TPA: hypothetical protein VKQ09_11005 [Sphingomonas sp.]|nr:hypothetical protein [Sphingomonas sp.]
MTVAGEATKAPSPIVELRWSWRVTLPFALTLGLALRLVALAVPSVHHPDEIFQYLEPAHRLVFGQGIVTWEWRYGMRSWFIPLGIAGLMKLGAWIAPNTALYLLLPKLATTMLSLVTVVTGWRLGERLSPLHALVGGLVGAAWWEFIYFAPHILSEAIAVALLLPAALLLTDRQGWTPRRLATAGAFLAVAGVARFQYLPAIAVLGLCTCGPRWKECWLPILFGGIAALISAALCDWVMGQTPFSWLTTNIRLNFVDNRSARYGESSTFEYLREWTVYWQIWIAPILALACLGVRRYPALAWTALANLGFHMAIAHKEYRFILLSSTLLILLAAMGSGELIDWVKRTRSADAAKRGLAVLLTGWLLASVSLAGAAELRGDWTRYGPDIHLYHRLRTDPALCGLAMFRFRLSGGYTYLHRAVPIQFFWGSASSVDRAFAERMPTFNTVIMSAPHLHTLPANFRLLDCDGTGEDRTCVYRRPGSCVADPASPYEINAVLRRYDQ